MATTLLGLWFTPVAVGAIYYFLPKIIARPIRSCQPVHPGLLDAGLLHARVGGHHLVGGPVPGWLITLSIVQSMMMIIPVLAFSINMGLTMRGHRLGMYSPTLRS